MDWTWMGCFLFITWHVEITRTYGLQSYTTNLQTGKSRCWKTRTFYRWNIFCAKKTMTWGNRSHSFPRWVHDSYQAIQKTWLLKGKHRIFPTYGKHQGVNLIDILNYKTCEIFYIEEEKYDVKVFLSFLEKVLAHYSTGTIVMILDNISVHHAKYIQPFLQANKNEFNLCFFHLTAHNLT